MPSFSGVDFIDFDSQLNDEEKLVRQTAREFVDNEILPSHRKTQPRGHVSHAPGAAAWGAGILRR